MRAGPLIGFSLGERAALAAISMAVGIHSLEHGHILVAVSWAIVMVAWVVSSAKHFDLEQRIADQMHLKGNGSGGVPV